MFKKHVPNDPAVLLGIYSFLECIAPNPICTKLSHAPFSVLGKHWKPPQCLSVDHSMYCFAFQGNETDSCVLKQSDLHDA